MESNEKLDVRRGAPQCPEEGTEDYAYIYRGAVPEYEKPGDHVFTESSWPDHLQAIRDGKRELLGLRIVKEGIYEAVRDDGSRLIFSRELPPRENPETK